MTNGSTHDASSFVHVLTRRGKPVSRWIDFLGLTLHDINTGHPRSTAFITTWNALDATGKALKALDLLTPRFFLADAVVKTRVMSVGKAAKLLKDRREECIPFVLGIDVDQDGEPQAAATGDVGVLKFLSVAFEAGSRNLATLGRIQRFLSKLGPTCAKRAGMVADAVTAIDEVIARRATIEATG